MNVWANGDIGSNAYTGTDLQHPKLTVAGVKASFTLAAGDVLNLGDVFTESASFSAASTVTFQQEPTYAATTWKGAVDPYLAGGTWSLHFGETYKITVPTDASDNRIVWAFDRWNSRVFDTVRHGGYLVKEAVPSAGTNLTARGKFAYDKTAGVMYVRLSDGTNPNANQGTLDAVCYCDANFANGLQLVGSTGCTVKNLTFRHFLGAGAQYGIAFECSDGVVDGVTIYDTEVHSLNCTPPNGVATVRSCRFIGAGNTNAAALLTFHNAQGHVLGRQNGNVFHCYGLLDASGNPIDSTKYISACYSHTDNDNSDTTQHRVTDLERTDETAWFYGNQGSGFDAGNTAALSGSKLLWRSYPARHTRCHMRNGSGTACSGNLAFRQGFYDFTKAANFATTNMFRLTQGPTVAAIAGNSVLLEACHLVVDLNMVGSDHNRNLFYLPTGTRLTLINCNIIVIAATTGWYQGIFYVQDGSNVAFSLGSAGFEINAYGNNFCFVSADASGVAQENDLILNDTNAPTASRNFSGNNYWHINSTIGFSYKSGIQSLANWLGTVDTTGTNVDPGFVNALDINPRTCGRLLASSALRSNRKNNIAAHATVGINGAPWAGLIGAWQDGSATRVAERMMRMGGL